MFHPEKIVCLAIFDIVREKIDMNRNEDLTIVLSDSENDEVNEYEENSFIIEVFDSDNDDDTGE